MKKMIFVIVTLLTVTLFSNAHAYFFPVKAYIQGNAYQASATVWNRFNRPIVCSGYVTGYTYYGQYVNSYMNSVVLYPGQASYIYVYTNYYQPFMNVVDSINCGFLF